MELKVAGSGKAPLTRGFGLLRGGNRRNRSNRVLEGVGKAGGGGGVVSCSEEDGVVRMKIVVKKSDLKQLIEAMSGGGGGGATYPSSTAEQRLNVLRRKHIARGNAVKAKRLDSNWTPALQSIPEEL